MSWALVTVNGYLGAKPTIKHFDSGAMVCTFTVYVNRQKGEEEAPLKFRAEVWSKQAETCMNLLDKGSKVTVTGTLDEETYENKEGKLVTINLIRFAQVLDYGTKASESP
jgi:single-strand DNA-binding protein